MIHETETRENRTDPIMTTFGLKTVMKIGFWNIRTMAEPSRLAQIAKEMENYRIDILGLSETRWNGSGEHTLQQKELLLYSGKSQGEKREYGVGLLISKKVKKNLIDWNPVSERIITARFQSRLRKVTIVQCYAPTETAEKENKLSFYDSLEAVLHNVKKSDILIVMGDLNAKIGNENQNLEDIIGKHGIGQRNENGELLLDLCSSQELTIGGSLFPHKNIHKVTWISPDGKTTNQIDHIMISKRWRKSIQDVRSYRGADIASDHHLVIAKIRLKISSNSNNTALVRRTKFNTERLNIPTIRKQMATELSAKLKPNEQVTNIAEEWRSIQKTVLDVSENILGKKNNKSKEWLTQDTWVKIEQRKIIKGRLMNAQLEEDREKLQLEYREANKEVKKAARRDKRTWTDHLAHGAQVAAETNNSRELYRITKQLAGNHGCIKSIVLQSSTGEKLTSPSDQIHRWEEYYRSMQHSEQPAQDWSNTSPSSTIKISASPPSMSEIKHAICHLKSNKAPGPDNIPAEILKIQPILVAKAIYPLINKAWNEEYIPEEWKEGLIINLPKKGDLSQCKNWRGITLLNSINKIFATIISSRLSDAIEPALRQNQAGFRPNRSCTDQINSLRIIVEQSLEFRSPLFLVFVDFEKAFDSLSHEALWNTLHVKGVPEKLINITKELYKDANCKVMHRGRMSGNICIEKGVKQGCVLSPLLFNIALDQVLTKVSNIPRGITWDLTTDLSDLDYADDICLLTHSHAAMQQKLQALQGEASKYGLKINASKTKEMRFNTNNTNRLYLNDSTIENVNQFVYLGSIIDNTGGAEADVSARIQKATASFRSLNNIWSSKIYSDRTKLRLFNTNVKSVLLYGCETWKINQTLVNKLQIFINKCLRRIMRIFWPEKISNEDLWTKCKQPKIQSIICRRKWGWLGHTLRKPTNDITRKALDWNPQGSRRVGRPKNTWRKTVQAEAHRLGYSWGEIKKLAQNRIRWRNLVDALCSTLE